MTATVSSQLRVFVGILSAVVLLSALAMLGASTVISVKPVWLMFGFELVIAVSTVFGIQFARGRYQDGQGLALACVAGTIAVGSVLGWVGAQRHLTTTHGDVSLHGWLLGRLGAAAALGAVAAVFVLSRDPRSWNYVARGVAFGLPPVLVAGVYVLKPALFSSAVGNMPGWVAGFLGVFGGVGAVALIAASAHYLIRAFELGRTE